MHRTILTADKKVELLEIKAMFTKFFNIINSKEDIKFTSFNIYNSLSYMLYNSLIPVTLEYNFLTDIDKVVITKSFLDDLTAAATTISVTKEPVAINFDPVELYLFVGDNYNKISYDADTQIMFNQAIPPLDAEEVTTEFSLFKKQLVDENFIKFGTDEIYIPNFLLNIFTAKSNLDLAFYKAEASDYAMFSGNINRFGNVKCAKVRYVKV